MKTYVSHNSRRSEGKCRAGLHDWVDSNIYVSPDGKRSCIKCRTKSKRRSLDRRRKHPVVEPEVETISRRRQPPSPRSHVPRDFWQRTMERVALLNSDEEVQVTFPARCAYQPSCSSIVWAAKRAGIRVGTEWSLENRCVYIWLVRGRKQGKAAA